MGPTQQSAAKANIPKTIMPFVIIAEHRGAATRPRVSKLVAHFGEELTGAGDVVLSDA